MRARRGGFTLVELIVVAVLGAILISATLQVLIINQRTYTAQNAQIQGQQAVRAALEVLTAEFREISPSGGDLVSMGASELRVRVGRTFGLICHDTTRGTPTFRVMRFGDWMNERDSVFVFADNRGEVMTDDRWITTVINARDTTRTCSGLPAQRLTFAGATAFTNDSVSSGGEVRVFTHFIYGLMTYSDGRQYLGRKTPAGSYVPLVGPLRNDDGIAFRYLDAAGTVTSTATDVAQIEITVRTDSDVLDSTGTPVRDSITVRVHTRN